MDLRPDDIAGTLDGSAERSNGCRGLTKGMDTIVDSARSRWNCRATSDGEDLESVSVRRRGPRSGIEAA